MLRLTSLKNQYRKRTLRVLYGQTQAYPYAARLLSSFDRTLGALSGANAITGAGAAIIPGLVATKAAGEVVTLSAARGTGQRAFGLFASFVGGQLDELGDSADIGVWRGVGSVYEVLAPAFDDTGLAAQAAAEDGLVATEVYLNSNAKGQLVADASGAGTIADTARLIERLSSKAVVVELLV